MPHGWPGTDEGFGGWSHSVRVKALVTGVIGSGEEPLNISKMRCPVEPLQNFVEAWGFH